MPPAFALTLCILFVFFLIRLDKKRNSTVSNSLWIPTLWLLYCGSRPVALWFSVGLSTGVEFNIEAGSPLDRNVLSALIVMGLLILATRKLDWRQVARDNTWAFLLTLHMLISVLWSPYPYISFKRWFRVTGSIVMALIVLTESEPQRAMESLLRRSVYILIPFSLLLVKFFPALGVEYHEDFGDAMWLGVTTQKNGLGRLCLVCALYLAWDLIRRSRTEHDSWSKIANFCDGLVLIMTLFLLKGPPGPAYTYSATSVVCLTLGIWIVISLIWFSEKWKVIGLSLSLVTFWIMVANVFSTMLLGNSLLSYFLSILGRGTNFTGRTDIWKELLQLAAQHPILGCGYGAFWIHPGISFNVNEGHNGFLDVYQELGIVGLVLLFGMLRTFYARAKKEIDGNPKQGSLYMSFFIVLVLHNLTESSFVRATSYVWTLLMYLAFTVPHANSRHYGIYELIRNRRFVNVGTVMLQSKVEK